MPIIFRPKEPGGIVNTNDVPPEWTGNRVEVDDKEVPDDRRKLSSSICTFVPKKFLKLVEGKCWITGPDYTCFEEKCMQAHAEVEERTKLLESYFESLLPQGSSETDKANAKLAAQKMPWPNFLDDPELRLYLGFEKQYVPSSATGFAIENGLVVSAGHFAKRFLELERGDSAKLEDWVAVFDMTGDRVQERKYSCFSITRILHSTYRSNHVDDSLTPTKWRLDADKAQKFYQRFDFCVFELDVPVGIQPPTPLPILPFPALKGTDVFLIGSPNGLSLKYVNGGKIRREVNLQSLDDKRDVLDLKDRDRGDFTADIDVFKGNSGGPLFQAGSNLVLGIVCAISWESFAIANYSSDPRDYSLLKSEIDKYLKAHATSTKPFVPVDSGFTDFFSHLALYSRTGELKRLESKTWTWNRFQADSLPIVQFNSFCRADVVAHLNRSLDLFRQPSAPAGNVIGGRHPGGTVNIKVGVTISGSATDKPLDSHLSLLIGTKTNKFEGETVGSGIRGEVASFVSGDELTYTFSPTDALLPKPLSDTPVDKSLARLPSSLLQTALLTWKNVKVKRKTGTVAFTQVKPVTGFIEVEFRFNYYTTAAEQGNELERKVFRFRSELVFKIGGSDELNVWVAQIGATNLAGRKSAWEGPL